MARKNRNLASFDDFANNNINKKVNDNNIINENINNDINNDINNGDNNYININDNVNVSSGDKKQVDYLDALIEGRMKKKENETVLTGIYIQKDLSQVLDRLSKKGGRGAKSKIVNEALRTIFTDKGLL
ncbi:hypothetical protein C0966_18360 (plasmid) [Bacillus methanolicus]|uniref:hypothetical protein n=1 Tax=Bacillus methanolicus TaxID=1471 RepID=UPI0023808596|nr:hypothetical protein [Bacillus methanolicus]MDE3841215.1 hypothetical protein [Bacillus methanolicus]